MARSLCGSSRFRVVSIKRRALSCVIVTRTTVPSLEDNVVLYKVENGRRSPLGPVGRSDDYGVKHAVPAGQWSTLAVVFDGARFTVSFDGEPLFDVVDATFDEPGQNRPVDESGQRDILRWIRI